MPTLKQLLEEQGTTKAPIAAGVCVRAADTGRVLMLQRGLFPGDDAGGTWEFPGGRLNVGETPGYGAIREWCEEVGFPVFPGSLPRGQWDGSNGKYQGFVYEVPSEDNIDLTLRESALNPDGDKFEAIAWVNPADFDGHNLRPELLADIGLVRAAMEKRLKVEGNKESEITRLQKLIAEAEAKKLWLAVSHLREKLRRIQGQKTLLGGLADGKLPSDFPPEALAEGTQVEMEHTDDETIAREIAMDHLTEDPEYYTKLRQVEGKAFSGKGGRYEVYGTLMPHQGAKDRFGDDILIGSTDNQDEAERMWDKVHGRPYSSGSILDTKDNFRIRRSITKASVDANSQLSMNTLPNGQFVIEDRGLIVKGPFDNEQEAGIELEKLTATIRDHKEDDKEEDPDMSKQVKSEEKASHLAPQARERGKKAGLNDLWNDTRTPNEYSSDAEMAKIWQDAYDKAQRDARSKGGFFPGDKVSFSQGRRTLHATVVPSNGQSSGGYVRVKIDSVDGPESSSFLQPGKTTNILSSELSRKSIAKSCSCVECQGEPCTTCQQSKVSKSIDKGQFLDNEDEETSVWVMTTGDVDRDNETVNPLGGDYSEFDSNPVVVDNHSTDGSVTDVVLGRVVEHWDDEVGEGTKWQQVKGPRRDAHLCKIKWNTATPKGQQAAQMAKAGMLNGGSISFAPLDTPQKNKQGGNHYNKWKLLEFTICPVGSNPSAVRLKNLKGQPMTVTRSPIAKSDATGWIVNGKSYPTYAAAAKAAKGVDKADTRSMSVEEALRLAEETKFPELSLLHKLANQAQRNPQRADGDPGPVFRSTPTYHHFEAWVRRNPPKSFSKGQAGRCPECSGPTEETHDGRFMCLECGWEGARSQTFSLTNKSSKGKHMARKCWINKRTKSVILLKADGPISEDQQEYLEQRGLTEDVEMADAPPVEAEGKSLIKDSEVVWGRDEPSLIQSEPDAWYVISRQSRRVLAGPMTDRNRAEVQATRWKAEDLVEWAEEEMTEPEHQEMSKSQVTSIYEERGQWFYALEGGSSGGPFPSKEAAERGAIRYGHTLPKSADPDEAQLKAELEEMVTEQVKTDATAPIDDETIAMAYGKACDDMDVPKSLRKSLYPSVKAGVRKKLKRKSMDPMEKGPLGYRSLNKLIKAIEEELASTDLENEVVRDAYGKAVKLLKGAKGKAYKALMKAEGEQEEVELAEREEDDVEEKRSPDAIWSNREGDIEIGPKDGPPFYIDIDGRTEYGPFNDLNAAKAKVRELSSGKPKSFSKHNKRISKAHKAVMQDATETLDDVVAASDTPKRLKSCIKGVSDNLKGIMKDAEPVVPEEMVELTEADGEILEEKFKSLERKFADLGNTHYQLTGLRSPFYNG